MKTIIIHHVQEMWNHGLLKSGTSFEEVIENVYNHLNENDYDKIIVTNFEANLTLDDEQWMLEEFYPIVYDYAYGWEREMLDETYVEGKDFVIGGQHSEIVLIDDWMHQLTGDIYICGAFDGECIEDLEIALNGAGKEFNRLNHLII